MVGDGVIAFLSSLQVGGVEGGRCHRLSVIIPGRGDGVIAFLSSFQVGGMVS